MKLAIIGNGEMALELYNLIVSCDKKNDYDDIFFVDLKEDRSKNVISEENFFKTDRKDSEILIATGEPFLRKKLFEKYSKEGFKFTTFVHPLSFISRGTELGEGTIVLPFVYIAQNTETGKNTLFHAGCKIENYCNIGDNCFVSVNVFVGAKTEIGETCFLGPGAVIRDSITVEKNCIIGMGAVVTKSTEENSVYIGNPARKIRENTTHKVFG